MIKIFHKNFCKRRAFTLIEVIISLTIFGIISTVGVNTFITTYRAAQQSAVENVLLEDSRFIMARLKEEIRNSTIDYEEYFNRNVVQAGEEWAFYARNHGMYDWQFFNGGINPGTNQEHGIGSLCQDANANYIPYPDEVNCVTGSLIESEDNSTGQFPANQHVNDPTEEVVRTTNSVCVTTDINAGYYDFDATELGHNDCTGLTLADHYRRNELYLINVDGTQKTIIKPKTALVGTDTVQVLSLLRMEAGETIDNRKLFTCAPEFPCGDDGDNPDYTDPPRDGEGGLYEGFLPISPLRTHIKDISFIISPLEDPRRAFAENFPEVRTQPQVTIVMTVEPVESLKPLFGRQNPEIQLQTTVTSRID